MKWTTPDHYFCEGKLNGLPEYYNAFSSLFITYFGLLGLHKTKNELIIQIIYSLLTVNGISSFMYHWTGNIGFALYDEYPMILSLFLGNIYVDNNSSCMGKFLTNKFCLHEIIGRSIIIHEDPDDLGKTNEKDSKTTGHSGKRIGCAVIGRSKNCEK